MSIHDENVNVPLILKNVTENEQDVQEGVNLDDLQKPTICLHCSQLSNGNVESITNQETELCSYCQTSLRAHTDSNEGIDSSLLPTAASKSVIHPPATTPAVPPAAPEASKQGTIQVEGKIEECQQIEEPRGSPSGYAESDNAETVEDRLLSPVADAPFTNSVTGCPDHVTGAHVTGAPVAGAHVAGSPVTAGPVTGGPDIVQLTVVLRTPADKHGADLKMSEGRWLVKTVKDHSLWRLSGVQIGDTLHTINGVQSSEFNSISAALQMRPCTLVFQRRVQIVSININEERVLPFDDLVCSAWCVCCFCNCCCGMCAINEATEARNAYQAGNLEEARRRNASARKYIGAAICSGIVVLVLRLGTLAAY